MFRQIKKEARATATKSKPGWTNASIASTVVVQSMLYCQCNIDQSQHSSILLTGVFQPFPSDQQFVRLILKKLSGSSYPRKWLSTVLISARNHWINIQRHNLLHAYSKKFGFAMSGKHFDSNPLLFMKYIHMYIVVEHPGNPIRMQWPFTWILTLWSSWTKVLVSMWDINDITLFCS